MAKDQGLSFLPFWPSLSHVYKLSDLTKASLLAHIFTVQQGKFTARVIQRELAMITNLMTPNNFKDVTKDDGSLFNVSTARVWFEVGMILM